MKKVILVLAILGVTFGFSQNNTSDLNTVKAYTKAFNAQDFDGIYSLYSEDSKQRTSLQSIEKYTKRLFATIGKINDIKFLSKEASLFSKFDLVLNNAKKDVFDLHVKLNAKHEIEDISFNKK